MSVKKALLYIFGTTVTVVTLGLCCTTLIDLYGFLSSIRLVTPKPIPDRNNGWKSVAWYLLVDQALLSVFVLQHSILSLPIVKRWRGFEYFDSFERCLYILATCLSLELMIRCWEPTLNINLWNFKTTWPFSVIHAFVWVVMYLGIVVLDPAEFIGLKQVYYYARNLGIPCQYKSRNLNRLLSRVRHSSFTGIFIILWVIPTMSLDRFLLATFMTSYMFIGWDVDKEDYRYQKQQLYKKLGELTRVN